MGQKKTENQQYGYQERNQILIKKDLKLRAKKKLVTKKIVLALIETAKKKGDTVMEKAFRRTYYCLNKVLVSDNKLFANIVKIVIVHFAIVFGRQK